MPQHHCKRCGGTLTHAEGAYICAHCQTTYPAETAERHTATLQELFDAQVQERVHNLRRVLYDAVTARYISRTAVQNACDALREWLPDDFAANFYRTASGHDPRALNTAIRAIDTEANYDEMETVLTFLIKSLSENPESLMATADLVERAYKRRDLKLYNKYMTLYSEQAELVEEGVFVPDLPRHVFVAYSSKDMPLVSELVEALEEQGISCFVAARNLRHGVGSIENYDTALKQAMDACRVVVFVSSMNSRNLACDALTVELPYIMNGDKQNAPAEYRNYYDKIPHKFKKPRVEYRIEESGRKNVADSKVDLFFSGYERVYDVDSVIERVAEYIYADPGFDDPVDEEEAEWTRQAELESLRQAEAAEQQRHAEEDERQRQAAEAERQRQEEARRRAAPQAQCEVGNTVKFGSYEQNPGKGKEPIEWIVLANEGNRALLISKYILDCQPYHTEKVAVTWETCSLRRWLNSTFLNAAFNATERGRILASKIKNPRNATYGTNGGNDTTDHIFCLSIDEANQFFSLDTERAAKATAATKAKGQIFSDGVGGNSLWWLRSPGYDLNSTARVYYTGGVNPIGYRVYNNDIGVRPALWINLES